MLSVTALCCGLAAALLFATTLWWDFSISLDIAPWRAAQDSALAAASREGGGCVEPPALRCPFFSDEEATEQCRACGCLVSKRAMHEASRGAAF